MKAGLPARAGAAVLLAALAGCGEQPADRSPAATEDTNPRKTGAGLAGLTPVERARAALRADPNVGLLTIEVQAQGDVIALKGRVDNADQREWAERVAREAAAVPIRNELVVAAAR